jgi:anti-sigma factor RsiW
MDCNELVELVTAYLDGALDPQERRRFEEHVAECDGCATYVEQFRTTIHTVGRLAPEDRPVRTDALLDLFRGWLADHPGDRG